LSSIDSLILGASGNLGGALCAFLLKKGRSVSGTFHIDPPALEGVDLHPADVAGDEPARLVRRLRPSRVYHLAWSTNLDECESAPEIAYGPARAGLKPLLEACRETEAHLIFMSSDGIFGDPGCERFEDSTPSPINHYGRGKVEAEHRIRESSASWTILRACPVGFNPRREKGLVNWVVGSLKSGKMVTGFSDSSFTPISVHTLTNVIAGIGAGQAGRILHFLSDPPVTKYEFLRRAAGLLKVSPEKVLKGSLKDARFAAPRPIRQDLQTRSPEERVFAAGDELELSLQN
jgi:dTDP-4-dehydrorhamnose reductase